MRKQVNEIVRIVAESLPKKIKVLETFPLCAVALVHTLKLAQNFPCHCLYTVLCTVFNYEKS